MQYADIIIDISQGQLDRTFQYRIPEELRVRLQIGSRVMVSFGSDKRKITGYVIGLSNTPKVDPARIRPIDGIVEDSVAVESTMIALAAWIREYYGSTMNQALKCVLPVRAKAAPAEKKDVILLLSREDAEAELDAMRSRKRHSVAKERLLTALISEQQIPWEVITGRLNVPSVNIRDFEKKGWVQVEAHREWRNPLSNLQDVHKQIALNPQQQIAYQTFARDWDQGMRKTYLLYGVTGSGKTEVYMEMIAHVLREGRQAILLIPEIALTYQTVMRLYGRFGDRVSIMNSRLSAGERYDQFERAKRGEIQIMVGPRSALFTPFPNLGLIVIDEEHEASYKSESVPKYHARETAIERARLSDASVVLGSATPSLESFARAKSGAYTLLRLDHRVDDRPLPECEVVDLRTELKEGNTSILSRRLQELMEDRLAKHQQTMLFVNRRGLMGFVSCRSCGHVIKCPHCDVALSLHNNGRLYCHYCGYSEPMPRTCPECGSKYIGGFRAGTQKFEAVVKERFPEARVLRMDADTTRGKNGHRQILDAFANHDADILIGTQMIVKGHDFEHVTLVGTLAADMSLNSGGFRGAERTFQLLTQAAGRAGRGDEGGRVVIQTYQPQHYSIQYAAAQDYDGFYEQEIAFRRLMEYPPAAHMLRIQIMSENGRACDDEAERIADLLQKHFPEIRISGPHDAVIARVADVYRKAIYLKDPVYDRLVAAKDVVADYLREDGSSSRVQVWFDFDPMSTF